MSIFAKSRQQSIESLELTSFLCDAHTKLSSKYFRSSNRFIKLCLKIIQIWRDWQIDQIKDYLQLLFDYPFWSFREYYVKCLQKFVRFELTAQGLIEEILDMGLAHRSEGLKLSEDYNRQKRLDLDPKSLGFGKIMTGLIPILEGYDSDPEESIFTEEEFRDIIESSFKKLNKYMN